MYTKLYVPVSCNCIEKIIAMLLCIIKRIRYYHFCILYSKSRCHKEVDFVRFRHHNLCHISTPCILRKYDKVGKKVRHCGKCYGLIGAWLPGMHLVPHGCQLCPCYDMMILGNQGRQLRKNALIREGIT